MTEDLYLSIGLKIGLVSLMFFWGTLAIRGFQHYIAFIRETKCPDVPNWMIVLCPLDMYDDEIFVWYGIIGGAISALMVFVWPVVIPLAVIAGLIIGSAHTLRFAARAGKNFQKNSSSSA